MFGRDNLQLHQLSYLADHINTRAHLRKRSRMVKQKEPPPLDCDRTEASIEHSVIP